MQGARTVEVTVGARADGASISAAGASSSGGRNSLTMMLREVKLSVSYAMAAGCSSIAKGCSCRACDSPTHACDSVVRAARSSDVAHCARS